MKEFAEEVRRQDKLVNQKKLLSRKNLVIAFLASSFACSVLDFGSLFVTMFNGAKNGNTGARLVLSLVMFSVDLKLLSTLAQPSAYFTEDRNWSWATLTDAAGLQGLFNEAKEKGIEERESTGGGGGTGLGGSGSGGGGSSSNNNGYDMAPLEFNATDGAEDYGIIDSRSGRPLETPTVRGNMNMEI